MPKPRRQPGSHEPRSPAPVRPLLSPGSLVALCAVLALALVHLHWQIVDLRFARDQTRWHELIIAGQGPYPDQYRALTYLLAEGLALAGLPLPRAHALLRFLFTAASLVLFHRYLMAWVRPPFALLGVFMVAAILPLTYLFYFMQPTDPANLLVFLAAFLAIRAGRDAWIVPLAAVGTLNRETAALIPALYALVRFRRTPWSRWLPWAVAALASAAVVYAGLRGFYGLRPPYAQTSPVHYWTANWNNYGTWFQVLGFFNLALWVGWKGLREAPPFLQRAAWLVPIFLVIHATVGYLREVRYFLPLLPVVVPLTLIALQRRTETDPQVRRH